jgi:plastocyanin
MSRIVFLMPAALFLAACGGGGSSSSGAPSSAVGQTIKISEKEFSLSPSTVRLAKSGTYEFQVTNDGAITHAFEIEENGVEEKTGDIAPGSAMTLRVTLSKTGSYDMYCPIDGHRAQGMKGSVAVGGASSSGQGTTTTSTKPGY